MTCVLGFIKSCLLRDNFFLFLKFICHTRDLRCHVQNAQVGSSSLTRDPTPTPCIRGRVWTTGPPGNSLSWDILLLKTSFCNRRERGRTQRLNEGHSPRTWHKPIRIKGTKMADKTRPWSSISKWNTTPRGAVTVPRPCQRPRRGRWPKSWGSLPPPTNSWTSSPTH